jgi:hypothetical protein
LIARKFQAAADPVSFRGAESFSVARDRIAYFTPPQAGTRPAQRKETALLEQACPGTRSGQTTIV